MMFVSAKNSYLIRQIDVIVAFSYRFLDEKIYIMQSVIFEDGTTRVKFLKKTLYNPKQILRI